MTGFRVVDGLGIGFGAIAIAIDSPSNATEGDAARESPQAKAARARGGVQLAISQHPAITRSLGSPPWWLAVLRPSIAAPERAVRNATPNTVALMKHVRQASLLAGAALAFECQDLTLLAECTAEAIVEPAVGPSFPGYFPAKNAALGAGAVLAGMTGDAREIAALCLDQATARRAADAMLEALGAHAITDVDIVVAKIAAAGTSHGAEQSAGELVSAPNDDADPESGETR